MLGEVAGVDEVMGLIAAVTPGDVERVANGLVASEKLNMAVVGPVRGQRRLEQAMADAFAGDPCRVTVVGWWTPLRTTLPTSSGRTDADALLSS